MSTKQILTSSEDVLPKTVVLHQQTGIGDLIWHTPYIRAIAKQSLNGKVSLVAAPSTLARHILAPEACIDEVIDYYHLPRSIDRASHKESSRYGRMREIVKTIQAKKFDRIVVLSSRASRGLLAYWTGIPQRLGYGYRWTQRLFLNTPPYIKPYEGKANPIYHDATAFCIAHGFCDAPIVPKMLIPSTLDEKVAQRLKHLPRPLYTLAIGSSEERKQWGQDNYTKLTIALAEQDFGVLLLGGKMDHVMASAIKNNTPKHLHQQIEIITNTPILESAAAVKYSDVCIGNDTGLSQIAAACDCLSFIILGSRPTLDHDPLQHYIVSDRLLNITSEQVMAELAQLPATGFK